MLLVGNIEKHDIHIHKNAEKSKNCKEIILRVTFLTVGEYPTINSLHMSQVLGFATYLKKTGCSVSWIALLPPENQVIDLLLGNKKLEKIRQLALEKGIHLIVKSFPISINYIHTYVFRKFLIHHAGNIVTKILQNNFKNNNLHIIHCRSYFATAVALEVKKELDIKISFDMRSLLPPEIPLYFPKIGKMFYGGLKEWESVLLSNADISFLQCNRGIKLLELEGIIKLPIFQPIAGFEKKHLHSLPDLSERINNPLFGYIGGFGPWHSKNLLRQIFDSLKKSLPNSKLEILTSKPTKLGSDVLSKSVSNDDVPNYLSRYLALLIPGAPNSHSFFSRLKSSSNFFSTKAAEALSIGIPIIVNALNTELAEYVRSQKCGLVFRVSQSGIEYEHISSDDLHDPALWKNLNDTALKTSSFFQRENVFNGYIEAWNRLLP